MLISQNFNWKDYMEQQDMVWNNFPTGWDDGAYIGNGLLGAMIYEENRALIFKLGRSDIMDKGKDIARLPIGQLRILMNQGIDMGNGRLDLWNGLWKGELTTGSNQVIVQSFVSSNPNVVVIEITGESSIECEIGWQPDLALSPRYFIRQLPVTYKNPLPVISRRDDIHYCYQELSCSSHYITGWKTIRVNENKILIYAAICYGTTDMDIHKELHEEINCAVTADLSHIKEGHYQYWNNYYKKSFMSIPDKRLESFYWIQLYKLASATREDTVPIDLMGPWVTDTAWPALWWNLNMQLTYWPILTSNHLELAKPLRRMLSNHQDNLKNTVPVEYQDGEAMALHRVTNYQLEGLEQVNYERCNLTWICHNYWLIYRHSMDENILLNEIYPLLRGAIHYYLQVLVKIDGRLHVPLGLSPEYDRMAEDCNMDLALIRWGCETLITICNEHNVDDNDYNKWVETLHLLVDYQIKDNKLLIGKEVPYDQSHRHYSHLLGIYPLYLIHYENKDQQVLMKESIEHWLSKSDKLRGYSYTGAASMYASMRNGDKAIEYLNRIFENNFILPNTMYKETSPVIETPLSAVKSLQDMLVQSWGGKLRIFPAIPQEWKDIYINHLLCEGAFLVSGIVKDGRLHVVEIESLKGKKLVLENPFSSEAAITINHGEMIIRKEKIIELVTCIGDIIKIQSKDLMETEVFITNKDVKKDNIHYFGNL